MTTTKKKPNGSLLKNSGNVRAQRLKSDSHNFRSHPDKNKSMIAASLTEVGPFRSIAVDGDNIVRAGNGVFEQAEKLGLRVTVVDAAPDELIAVRRKDLKGKAAERAGLFDNATQETSEWDYGLIADLAQRDRTQLQGIKTDAELNAIIRRAQGEQLAREQGFDSTPDSVEQHDDNLKKYAAKWKVTQGDVWEANGHLVIADDCTSPTALEVIGKNVQCIFTSPPYADRRDATYGGIPSDKYVSWWETIQVAAAHVLRDDGSFLLNLKPHCDDGQRVLYVFDLVLAMCRDWNWKLIDELSWLKTPLPGDFHTRFKNAFEPVYHFSKTTHPKVFREQVATYGDEAFTADNRKMSVQSGGAYVRGDISKPGLVYPSNVVHATAGKIGGHPAAFPLSLADFMVQAFSAVGDKVYDPFGGSGTTLISAVRNNRMGVTCELDVRYVPFILERLSWEELEPIKVQAGTKAAKSKSKAKR